MKNLKQIFMVLSLCAANVCIAAAPAAPQAVDPEIAAKGFTNPKVREDDPDIGTFVKLAKAAGLINLFEGTGPFTAFMPSNEAFKRQGDKQINEWLKPENRDKLAVLILYHIVPGRYTEKNLKTRELGTLNGKKINITVSETGDITVNGAKVVKKDITGPNGEIYVIDRMLTP